MAIFSHSFSLILIFYHFVSIRYRWLSGRRISAIGLYPTYGLGVNLSIPPAEGVWRKFPLGNLQHVDAYADFFPGGAPGVAQVRFPHRPVDSSA
jgi:hypothetical protein